VAPPRRGPRVVAGERGVAFVGDVTNSVVNTGDNNTYNLYVGPEAGALLVQAGLLQRPRVKLRPRPILLRPPVFPGHLDRDEETERVDGQGPVLNVHGQAGIGKTYVLTHAANRVDAAKHRDGVVYLSAAEKGIGDLTQELFEAFYEPPIKPSGPQVQRLLGLRRALVLVDSFEHEGSAAQDLVRLAPSCRFVFSSRARTVWDWDAYELAGLPLADSLALVRQELGRELEQDEKAAAEEIWQAVGGNRGEGTRTAARGDCARAPRRQSRRVVRG